MSRKRSRGLRPEEEELWQKVARTAVPMHGVAPRRAPASTPPQVDPRKPAEPVPRPPIAPFRLGQTAARPAETAVRAPRHEAPVQMDMKTHGRMKRGKLSPEARIDLHGLTLAEAQPELVRFIHAAHGAGRRLVLVITGKGRGGRADDQGTIPQRSGVLKRQVPLWLAAPPLGPLVLQVGEAHVKHGGAGAYYVYLRRVRG